jgi:Ribbon-helix-helix domain
MVTAIGAEMAAMKGDQIVTSVYLEKDQYEKLQELSKATGAPMAHWIRRGVDKVLAEQGWGGFDPIPSPRPRSKAKHK